MNQDGPKKKKIFWSSRLDKSVWLHVYQFRPGCASQHQTHHLAKSQMQQCSLAPYCPKKFSKSCNFQVILRENPN